MPSKVDKLHVFYDRRKKLSDEDKKLIRTLYDQGWAIRALGRKFEVDRRLIQFILFPERLERNKQLRRERLLLDPQRYYDRETHSAAVKDIRLRKKIENIELFTKTCPICGKVFFAKPSNKIYCSNKCMWTMGNRRKYAKNKLAK